MRIQLSIGATESVAALALSALALSTSAFATTVSGEDPATDSLWEMNLAAFARHGPAYPAAGDTQTNVVPLPFPVYRGKFLRLGDDSDSPIRGRVFRGDRVKLDIDFDLNFGSDSKDIEARDGMPDLDLLLELGPELELQFVDQGWLEADAFLALQLRGALSWDGLDPTYEGLVFSPEIRFTRELGGPRQQLKLRITPTFASNGYMDYFYTVAPGFATAERPAYQAESGYLGTELSVSLRWPIARRIEVWGGIRQGFHNGATNEDSPLFRDDTTTAFYGAILYRFWESKRRVSDD